MAKIETVLEKEIKSIVNENFETWASLVKTIEDAYTTTKEWHTGGKAAPYELKFRIKSRTLVSLFPRAENIGVMVIFGKNEQEKFESQKNAFPKSIVTAYESAKTYRDGKWVMFAAPLPALEDNLIAILSLKQPPNK